MKINIKLMIIFLIVSLGPLIIVGFIEYSINKKDMITDLKKRFTKGASNLIHDIDIIMYRFYEDMRAFNEGKVPVFEYNTEEDITTYLNGKKKKFGYSSLSYFDKNMIKIADTDGHGIGKKQKIVPYVVDILAGKISTGSYIRFLKAAGETMFIYFAAPIRNRHGKLIGYISAKYNPLEIKDLIKIEFEKEFHTTLIDENRNIIFSNCDILKHWVFIKKFPISKSVKNVLSKNDGFGEEYFEFGNKTIFTAYAYERGYKDFKGNNWSIIVHTDKKIAFNPISALNKLSNFK